jgi:hypothetical protein
VAQPALFRGGGYDLPGLTTSGGGLTADGDRIFHLWFGERDYQKHFNLATVERAQGGIRFILDSVRRD